MHLLGVAQGETSSVSFDKSTALAAAYATAALIRSFVIFAARDVTD